MIFTSCVAVAVVLRKRRDSRTWMETGGPGNHAARAILAVGKGLVREYASAIILRE